MADRRVAECHPEIPHRARGKCRRCYQRDYRAAKPESAGAYGASYARARKQRIDQLKTKPCVDCGRTFPPECMDFDHVRGTKDRQIADMRHYSIARLEIEMAKCDLVCANCHRIRTRARMVAQHGR